MAASKKIQKQEPRSGPRRPAPPWRLSEYLPYHLSFTAELMSVEQARVIQEATGFSMHEWRVMAVIGSFQPLSTRTVASFTTMNKVAVSRAVGSLVERGYLLREIDTQDSRLLRLEFSAEGRKAFRRLSRVISDWSASILEPLSSEETRLLKSLLAKIRGRVRETAGSDWPMNDKQLFGEV